MHTTRIVTLLLLCSLLLGGCISQSQLRQDAPRADWFPAAGYETDPFVTWVSTDGVEIKLARQSPITAVVAFHPEAEMQVYANNAMHRVGKVTVTVTLTKLLIEKTFRDAWQPKQPIVTIEDDRVVVSERMARSVADFVDQYRLAGAEGDSAELLRKLRHSKRIVVRRF